MILPWLETKQPGENPCIPLCDHIPFYVPMPGIEHLLLLLEARVLTTDNPWTCTFLPCMTTVINEAKLGVDFQKTMSPTKYGWQKFTKIKFIGNQFESLTVSVGQVFTAQLRAGRYSGHVGDPMSYLCLLGNVVILVSGETYITFCLAFEPAILFSLNLQNILDQWVIYTIIRELHCRK